MTTRKNKPTKPKQPQTKAPEVNGDEPQAETPKQPSRPHAEHCPKGFDKNNDFMLISKARENHCEGPNVPVYRVLHRPTQKAATAEAG